MSENSIPAEDLIALARRLQTPLDASQRGDLGVYMRGCNQGRGLAATEIIRLLREYGIEVPEQEPEG